MSEDISSFLSGDNVDGRAWLDVESEPKIFSSIIRRFGAKGINVQELYGLESDYFAMLSGEVLGLIFLFNYRDIDGEEGEEAQNCPPHVWFANQTTNNACATVALLNILFNIPGLRFDAHGSDRLEAFRDSTMELPSVKRGQLLSDEGSIRKIHNSFARKVDVLNAALALQNEFDEWRKSRRNPRKPPPKKRKTSGNKNKMEHGDEAYHYIAYVPIRGEVWRLDGLLKQPVNLGSFEDDWTKVARDNIRERINEEEDLQYSLMALCADEEQAVLRKCLRNAVSIAELIEKTPETPDWRQYWHSDERKPMQQAELLHTFGLAPKQLSRHRHFAQDTLARLEVQDPLILLRQLVGEQEELKIVYQKVTIHDSQEIEDGDKTEEDHTAITYEVMKTLIEAGRV